MGNLFLSRSTGHSDMSSKSNDFPSLLPFLQTRTILLFYELPDVNRDKHHVTLKTSFDIFFRS
ncbi:hypothetical protein LEP1GSC068_1209 [Leptospira sp. Fiocruz LV3954]|nr:hypothetical protein LEP1GSC068_1209 [Leptospira sp. Fiocruz LV3954]EMI66505.1 hypothetical protein LEP1GSC076_3744 [Leptospira sp. Fiocruz LV4135]